MMSSQIYSYVCIPVVDMRAAPTSSSEVVSQALFSELVETLEEKGEWLKISTTVDSYCGWVLKHSIFGRETLFPSKNSVQVDRLAAHLYHEPDTIYGPKLTLPYESRLELLEPPHTVDQRWLKVGLPNGHQGYIQRGDVTFHPLKIEQKEICETSKRFLGLPYTWGGRSSFGYDCSGYVQMLYRMMERHIPRDAKDQILWSGFRRTDIDDLCPSDLVFFGFSPEKIRHVGFYLGEGRFIHAVASAENAPYIRISHLSDPAWNGSGLYPYITARTCVS